MSKRREQAIDGGNAGPRIVILGAGMSGLCMGVQLARAGIRSFTIVEMSARLGGTWWDNTYPGAQCDVRSHLYSFSFAPNPDWSRVFAPQREILAYMEGVAARWNLLPHMRFGTQVVAAHFDPARKRWDIHTAHGDRLEADVFICSTGPLSEPRWPEVPGLADFGGALMHTARWDHSYDVGGKRIAVIGTAASAVQLIPEIAPRVQQLHVFQRTPNWIVPRPDRPYRVWEKALAHVPPFGRLRRWVHYWLHERNRLGFEQGTRMAALATGFARHHLRRQIHDPALAAKLEPNYPFGCKRVLLSNDYYPALCKPNVELVTDAIARIDRDAVVTADGRSRPVDAIVCATGFDTLHPLASIDVRGRNGEKLAGVWRDAARAYHGVTVAGFPNFFLLLGPNTGTGHTSTLLYIEPQVGYVMRALRELEHRQRAWLDVRAETMAEHNRALQARLSTTVWAGSCSSWYKTPGGHIAAIFPGYSFQYSRTMRTLGFEGYDFG